MSIRTTRNPGYSVSALSEEERLEKLALFMELEPYLAHCLVLNHEINNPLTGILGYGEFMLADINLLPEETRDLLKKVMECAERVKVLVDVLSEAKADLSERVEIDELLRRYSSSESN